MWKITYNYARFSPFVLFLFGDKDFYIEDSANLVYNSYDISPLEYR